MIRERGRLERKGVSIFLATVPRLNWKLRQQEGEEAFKRGGNYARPDGAGHQQRKMVGKDLFFTITDNET